MEENECKLGIRKQSIAANMTVSARDRHLVFAINADLSPDQLPHARNATEAVAVVSKERVAATIAACIKLAPSQMPKNDHSRRVSKKKRSKKKIDQKCAVSSSGSHKRAQQVVSLNKSLQTFTNAPKRWIRRETSRSVE
jgi:hypothetical protein